MDTKQMIIELRREAERHKDDMTFTGQTNISAMCSDVASKLEELYKEHKFLEFLCDTIGINKMEKYNSMYYAENQKVNGGI